MLGRNAITSLYDSHSKYRFEIKIEDFSAEIYYLKVKSLKIHRK